VKRALSPLTNGVGYTALASLLLAIAQAAYNAVNSGQPVTWQVIATAGVGVLAGWARGKVTPVTDPRDGNGQPLLTADQHAAEHIKHSLELAAKGGYAPLVVQSPSMANTAPDRYDLSAAERRRAENLRLMHAPDSASFYPYAADDPFHEPQPVLPAQALADASGIGQNTGSPAARPPAQTATTQPATPPPAPEGTTP